MKRLEFLYDHTGKMSDMRVKTFLLLVVGLYVIVYQTMTKTIDHWLIIELLAIAFGFKAYQTQQENQKLKIEKETKAG